MVSVWNLAPVRDPKAQWISIGVAGNSQLGLSNSKSGAYNGGDNGGDNYGELS